MLLPNAERAIIDPPKLHDYLRSASHPVGRFKARFFAALGFTADKPTSRTPPASRRPRQPCARARDLESLDDLTPEENTQVWAEEAERRAAAADAGRLSMRPADAVFRDARARV